MTNKEILDKTGNYVAHTYGRFPVAMVEGKGARLWDADGKEYLDFLSGLAVTNLGHCHPAVVEAVRLQAGRLMHVSNFFHIEPQAELARLICENSFADKVFFCNSGAESIEAAIKLTRRYFHDKGRPKSHIISMERSFHGRTMAALSATAKPDIQVGFAPLLESFTYVPFGDINAIRQAITPDTGAILLEPIQGEGGVNLPPDGFLKAVRKLADEKGLLLIFDEVQVGMGRTAKLFAYEHSGVEPDIMTLAKGLGGGLAIGAICATEKVAASFVPGTHASTFGGNPLATAAGVAAIKTTLEDGILENCQKSSAYLFKGLELLKEDFGFIEEIRGEGLIIGMQLSIPGGDIVKSALDSGLLINCTAGNVLRFIPPLTITCVEIDEMLGILKTALENVKKDNR